MNRLFEGLALFLLNAQAILIALNYPQLPAQVPTHFDALGQPDAFGAKMSLWWLFVLSAGIYMLLSVIRFVPPRLWATPTPEPISDKQRALILEMLAGLKVLVMLLFGVIIQQTIAVALGQAGSPLMIYVFPVAICAPLALIAVYMVRIFRVK